MKTHKDDFPVTRFNPGTLPEPPSHFGEEASNYFWKLCSWMKVRTALDATVSEIEDISELLAMHEDEELEPVDRDQALFNANYRLRKIGFSTVDFEHLKIPLHKDA